MKHKIKWFAPSPLWGEQSAWIRLPKQNQLVQPIILRFANDAFMDELLAMLTHSPWRIKDWVAQPETWREPMPSPKSIVKTRPEYCLRQPYNKIKLLFHRCSKEKQAPQIQHVAQKSVSLPDTAGENPLKLYQAAHQRYYIVTASLVSEESGYPDYSLDLSNNERATFVVRALVPASKKGRNKYDEYACVSTPTGMAWRKAARYTRDNGAVHKLIPHEEQLPLFPITYNDQCGHHRQILGGLIPVGKREGWLAAPACAENIDCEIANPVPSTEGGVDHLKEIFYADVIAPWKALVDQAQFVKASLTTDSATFSNFEWNETKANLDKARVLRTTRDEIQTGSWYLLLDFAKFIKQYLPQIWAVMINEASQGTLKHVEQSFHDLLENTTLPEELFVTIAIENIVIAKNKIDIAKLWDELNAIWELEEKLDLSRWPYDVDDAQYVYESIAAENIDPDDKSLFGTFLDRMRSETWYTVLDIAIHLERYIPNLKKMVLGHISEDDLNQDEKDRIQAIITTLQEAEAPHNFVSAVGVDNLSDERIDIKNSLLDALVAVDAYEKDLEEVVLPFERSTPPPEGNESPVIDKLWPNFLFPLADPDPNIDIKNSVLVPSIAGIGLEKLEGLELLHAKLDALADLVDSLLPASPEKPGKTAEINKQPLLDQRNARFVVRCVFERPNCGPLFPPLVSASTCKLEMAPFFDPDAPARPVRIPLPVDISPAGLRKYKKNAMFLISDMLCGKIKKIKKLKLADLVLSVLPWPFHKDLPEVGPTGPCRSNGETIGMICSLSIPIVTLCALILLIIMVPLFNVFFRWLPYLFTCLPLPGLKKSKG